jgi:UDP-glucuronate decarboxylase
MTSDELIKGEVARLAIEFRKEFAGRRTLVTGGAGFLGSWLCDVLVEAGGRVDCLDNLSTGRMENIEHLDGKVRMLIGDVEKVELDRKYHYIFHLSSRASPEEYQQHPIETLTSNSVGTLRILEHVGRSESVLVFASTSEVYGDAQVVPTPETYFGNVNPVGVRSCYDEGKRFGEALCMAFFRQRKVKVRIARIFNSYGPRIREDGLYARAMPKFIAQALKGEPITIYGDGRQTRSFCYATDTVRGLLKLATAPRLDGEVVNIGNRQEMTILELARTITRKTGSKSKITFLPPQPDDPKRRCPDTSKAERLLGWRASVGLEQGLANTLDYFREKTRPASLNPASGRV